jgi:4-hydroxy-3-polyprenylbenzoate decarboxylase
VHQTKANKKGLPLKVSCFVGGPPAHSVAAVMPLPEGMSEMNFAGVLAGKRFGYTYKDGFCISTDADFVITGEVFPGENKPEGPFGDHLGYYSLQHPFPVMKVHKVYARKNAIWAFTVVGRPPQEDTSFGQLIHSMTGSAVSNEIPGLKEVHAVDAAGVHPLLLAIGSERYTPYLQNKKPAEILTIANHILGTGQLSLAKFVFITADDSNQISTHEVPAYLQFLLERIDLTSDIHFYTKTTMDTLDYSGENLNAGSKVVIAAYGDVKRSLASNVPEQIHQLNANAKLVLPGIIALDAALINTKGLQEKLKGQGANLLNELGVVMLILTENPSWMAETINNFLWACFTRTNPSHDMEGVDSFIDQKHWGSNGPLIFDATIKKHHAPPVEKNAAIEKRVDTILAKYGY